ncbi:MAG: alpha/beta fold hydrolase [Oligoflexales bacterium]
MPGLAYGTESKHMAQDLSQKRDDLFKKRLDYGFFSSPVDQTSIRYCYAAPQEEASLCVVVLNGRGEFYEKYLDLFQDLSLPEDAGFLSWDHRGQGLSGGDRAWVSDFHDYGKDAEALIQNFLGDRPYVIVAHSMGGLIALHSILHGRLKPQKLFLSAPFLGLPLKPWPPIVAAFLCTFFMRLGLGKWSLSTSTKMPDFDRNTLTHSLKRYQRMMDFEGRIGEPTFGWVVSAVKALKEVHQEKMYDALKTVDVFMAQAGSEKIVDPQMGRRWAEKAKSKHIHLEHCEIEGAYHELLAEDEKFYQPLVQKISRWIVRDHS